MANIVLTDAAKSYIRAYIQKESGVGFRLSIKKTGCSGYTYVPSVVSEVKPNDTKLTIDEMSVFLDTAWLDLLDGISIDYISDEQGGLKQKRLMIRNIKETGRCGCGESFHLKDDK